MDLMSELRALQWTEHVCENGCHVSETNPDMVLGTNDWMLANINMKGFYRVNYDSDNWERLLARLASNPEVQTVSGHHAEVFWCVPSAKKHLFSGYSID